LDLIGTRKFILKQGSDILKCNVLLPNPFDEVVIREMTPVSAIPLKTSTP